MRVSLATPDPIRYHVPWFWALETQQEIELRENIGEVGMVLDPLAIGLGDALTLGGTPRIAQRDKPVVRR